MIDAIHAGKLKAMYLFGEEIALVDANANDVQERLSKLEFFVAQDIFFSKTCQYADVILPASPSLEKEGTFTSTERRIQRLYQVLEPLEGSRPDWRIIQDVANHLGANWNYAHPSEIYEEIAALTPLFAGVTYERLEGYKSLQWPVAADGTDQPLLYTKEFAMPDGKAKLYPLVHAHADRLAERGIRSASEQRPHARAFPRGQHDLPKLTASARKCRTPSSKFRRNWPRSAASKAAPGCSSSRATARCASARW